MRFITVAFLMAVCTVGCTTLPEVKQDHYAVLSNKKTFNSDIDKVWKALQPIMANYTLLERIPAQPTSPPVPVRSIKTDWVYSQSSDKYQEYAINGVPQRILLPSRYRFEISVKKVLGGTEVVVLTEEEVERVKKDGTSAGYSKSKTPNPILANELLEKLKFTLLTE